MVKNINKKTAIGSGLVVAGASQLSRNKNIRNAGMMVLFVTVLGTIGELLGFLIKWLMWKPIVLIAKGFCFLFIWTFKIIYYYPIIYGYKGVNKFYNYLKIKYNTKKAI